MADNRPLAKRLRHAAEVAALYPLFALFRLLPFPVASAVGGWFGRLIGPMLPPSSVARRNLMLAVGVEGSVLRLEFGVLASEVNLVRLAVVPDDQGSTFVARRQA